MVSELNDTKGQISSYSIYMKFLEKANSQRREVDKRMPRAGAIGIA